MRRLEQEKKKKADDEKRKMAADHQFAVAQQRMQAMKMREEA